MTFEVVAGSGRHKVSDLDELIARQGSSFNVDNVIDAAKILDKSIRKTSADTLLTNFPHSKEPMTVPKGARRTKEWSPGPLFLTLLGQKV